ncbi:hypothetical protein [Gudongella sp. DL1XJH-153]|uniref:hypothetical protein n=1 Tax=Gudongella sp. DL1XJH-153 TaxID=3409804 RepID=UPI003BB7AB31
MNKKNIEEDLSEILIRNSRDGKILTVLEIEHLLNLDKVDETLDVPEMLLNLKDELELKTIEDAEAQTFYYSGKEMTDKYAGIIIRVKNKDIIRLVADTVREESRRYPRPTYVTMFNLPPYDLSSGELEEMLSEISFDSEYNDLKFTSASNGALFIYSGKYMSKGYADYLAEWIEVGQDENP